MMLTSLHTKLSAEKHLADEEVLQVIKKQRGVPKITRKNSNTSDIQKRSVTFQT
jgi:hypothetical protein